MPVSTVLDGNLPASIKGQRLGVVSNHTGFNRQFVRTAQVLQQAGATIGALFGPEHGYYGVEAEGKSVDEVEIDPATGAPVYSLYRPDRGGEGDHGEDEAGGKLATAYSPPPGSLDGLDGLVFDIQDVGARYYTYPSTLGILLEHSGLPVYVVDRPNPLGGIAWEGQLVDPAYSSFVGRYSGIPIIHGLTIGELGSYINRYILNSQADLQVWKMVGWQRNAGWQGSNLPWVASSPNLPTLETAVVYPATCLFEGLNLSVGRGTAVPFQVIGAPWITNPDLLATELNRLNRPEVSFRATYFKPVASVYAGQRCGGVQIHSALPPQSVVPPEIVRTGLFMIATVVKLFAEKLEWNTVHFDRLIGDSQPRLLLEKFTGDLTIFDSLLHNWALQEAHFAQQRADLLLY